ncbi:Cytochrome P450 CYP9AJ3 [Operophtera brumata]|uniref:unspecific monooxygenase n=1 Tax=Operophtera brumata TaxID=104452 RepID=A0A0L7KS62_OPEBR|nr:Cytochrome P450 CYP9AJ3 [Operophtera brumata]
MRLAVTPAFSSARCKGMMPLMEDSARGVEEYLSGKVEGATVMDVNDITMPYVNDVISSCAFGFAVNTLKDPENNAAFPEVDLVAQAISFYIAGFDTTANLINYFLYEMAINPDVQEKLQHKIDALDAEADVYEQLQALEYMDMCVSEVLRLWPLEGASDRRSVGTYDFGPTYPGSKDRLIGPASQSKRLRSSYSGSSGSTEPERSTSPSDCHREPSCCDPRTDIS